MSLTYVISEQETSSTLNSTDFNDGEVPFSRYISVHLLRTFFKVLSFDVESTAIGEDGRDCLRALLIEPYETHNRLPLEYL